jgi:hypothetical protein
MAQAAMLYRRVVYVVTGSGIGPLLGQILANRVPGRMVWSTRSPRATSGDALVHDLERRGIPAFGPIWDS